jgi:hypothetical protein|tara:strand:- start:5616 stop:6215 length:600 start_codon:yes stop_codon:yes gene_type:complete
MIIGNVPESVSEPIRATLLNSSYFPWYMITETTRYDPTYNDSIPDELSGEDPQFQHTVLNNKGEVTSQSSYDLVVEPLWRYIVTNYDNELGSFENFRRIKINLLTKKESKHMYHTPHVDYDYPHKTLLYYVNDSDGPTYFFNEKYDGTRKKLTIKEKVEPRQGRFIIFDGHRFHASSNPQYHDYRCVVNFNYISNFSSN